MVSLALREEPILEKRRKGSKHLLRLIRVLSAEPNRLSPSELFRRANFKSWDSLYSTLNLASSLRFVEKDVEGRYAITSKGTDYLELQRLREERKEYLTKFYRWDKRADLVYGEDWVLFSRYIPGVGKILNENPEALSLFKEAAKLAFEFATTHILKGSRCSYHPPTHLFMGRAQETGRPILDSKLETEDTFRGIFIDYALDALEEKLSKGQIQRQTLPIRIKAYFHHSIRDVLEEPPRIERDTSGVINIYIKPKGVEWEPGKYEQSANVIVELKDKYMIFVREGNALVERRIISKEELRSIKQGAHDRYVYTSPGIQIRHMR